MISIRNKGKLAGSHVQPRIHNSAKPTQLGLSGIGELENVKTPNFPKNLKFLNLHNININAVN